MNLRMITAIGMVLFYELGAFGSTMAPDCMGANSLLPTNNAEVLRWKKTTPNQYHNRGHVQGKISKIYADQSGHQHFSVALGKGSDDTVEVIYNTDFGPTPDPYIGMQVEACGDFVTSYAPTRNYPASPDGAILHWVHINPNGSGHPSGFLILDDVLCGQGENAE